MRNKKTYRGYPLIKPVGFAVEVQDRGGDGKLYHLYWGRSKQFNVDCLEQAAFYKTEKKAEKASAHARNYYVAAKVIDISDRFVQCFAADVMEWYRRKPTITIISYWVPTNDDNLKDHCRTKKDALLSAKEETKKELKELIEDHRDAVKEKQESIATLSVAIKKLKK